MTEYTFYKPDGTITVNLDIAPQELPMNLRPGESYVEGYFPGNVYEIKNGVPAHRPAGANPFFGRSSGTQSAS